MDNIQIETVIIFWHCSGQIRNHLIWLLADHVQDNQKLLIGQ